MARRSPLRVVAYVRASIHDPLDGFRTPEEQERALARWAGRCGHELVGSIREDRAGGGEAVSTRVGFVEALDRIRDRRADAIAVERLDRLAIDVVAQELLIAEARRVGGRVLSATSSETALVRDPSADATRALIRSVLASASSFGPALREARVLARVVADGSDAAAERAAISRLEQLAEQGVRLDEIRETLDAARVQARRRTNRIVQHLRRTRFDTTPNSR